MNSLINDETLAAYALNELDDTTRNEVEKALETNEEARKRLVEFQAAAHLATEALREAPVQTLENSQREKILQKAREESIYPKEARPFSKRRKQWPSLKKWVLVGIAASLVVIVGGSILFSGAVRTVSKSSGLTLSYGEPLQKQETPSNVESFFSHDDLKAGISSDGDGVADSGQRSPWFVDSNLGIKDNYGDGLQNLGGIGSFGGGGGGSGGSSLQNVVVGGELRVGSDTSKAGEAPAQAPSEPPAENLPKPDRYLIKNADFLIEAADPKQASAQIITAVTAAGGYVANQQESVDTLDRVNILLQVRVPADKIDGTLEGIQALGRVLKKQVSTDDVTEEYMDTESRIRNLKKTEERLLDHLDKSLLMESTLKVEQELTRVREQLERLEGRLKYLGHRVEFSTITVRFQEKPKAESILPPNTYSSGQVVSEAARALFSFAQALWTKIIWMAVWSPVWGVVILLLWIARRTIKKFRR